MALSTSAAIRPGLERMVPLLHRLHDPHRSFPVIHIAGTNCKGTTSSILDSLLTRLGVSTARFNSPHLRHQRDSCRLAGEVVDASVWADAGERVREANTATQSSSSSADDDGPIDATPFELLFARFLVSCTLSHPPPQVLIVECGMGGLLDATNVFPSEKVLACVITPIGRDHAAFLGDSLQEITENKLGIAKENGLVVVADQGSMGTPFNPRRWSSEDEEVNVVGSAAADVLATIRRVAETLKARLVRCQMPVVDMAKGHQERGQWRITSQWSVPLPPILQAPDSLKSATTDSATGVSLDEPGSSSITSQAPLLPSSGSLASTLFTNHPFLALPGHNTLTTPPLPPMQPTIPVISSVSTALSTIYSIASDEPPSARLLGGGDEHEELRLKLAWALRESGLVSGIGGEISENLNEAIAYGVDSWEGRGSWIDFPFGADEGQHGTISQEQNMKLFVDGAHNLPALSALFKHVEAMLLARKSAASSRPLPLTLTLLVSFSSSKKKDGDLDTLLEYLAQLPKRLLTHDTQGSPKDSLLSTRICFVPFSTPIEGMPWVLPLEPKELATSLHSRVEQSVKSNMMEFEITYRDTLEEGLRWAWRNVQESGTPFIHHDDTQEGEDQGRDSLVILTGSLYLAGELYRLLDRVRAGEVGRST